MFEVGTNEPVPSLSRLFLFGSDSAHRCEALQLDPNSFRPFLNSMGDGQAHPACSPPTRLSGGGWKWVGLRAGDRKPVFGTLVSRSSCPRGKPGRPPPAKLVEDCCTATLILAVGASTLYHQASYRAGWWRTA